MHFSENKVHLVALWFGWNSDPKDGTKGDFVASHWYGDMDNYCIRWASDFTSFILTNEVLFFNANSCRKVKVKGWCGLIQQFYSKYYLPAYLDKCYRSVHVKKLKLTKRYFFPLFFLRKNKNPDFSFFFREKNTKSQILVFFLRKIN